MSTYHRPAHGRCPTSHDTRVERLHRQQRLERARTRDMERERKSGKRQDQQRRGRPWRGEPEVTVS